MLVNELLEIYGVQDPNVDAFLAHHGVKGMHWGVRKNRTPEQQRKADLTKVNQKIDKLDGYKIVEGHELRGWALNKQYKREIKKNPDFAYRGLTEAQKIEYQKKASRRVTRSTILRGAAEVSLILAAGTLGVKSAKVNRDATIGAEVAVILLAGQVGKTRMGQVSSIRESNRSEQLKRKRTELGGDPKRRKNVNRGV